MPWELEYYSILRSCRTFGINSSERMQSNKERAPSWACSCRALLFCCSIAVLLFPCIGRVSTQDKTQNKQGRTFTLQLGWGQLCSLCNIQADKGAPLQRIPDDFVLEQTSRERVHLTIRSEDCTCTQLSRRSARNLDSPLCASHISLLNITICLRLSLKPAIMGSQCCATLYHPVWPTKGNLWVGE